ncbi:MAG: DUF2085 domain-containing protein [Candidatus Thermoplasmatota archaeon]
MNKSIPIFIVLFISLFWAISIFVSPFLIPSGSVRGLDGYANSIDYSDLWDNMPLFPRIIYTIGDFNCHQKEDRTFIINEDQMPVCTRDTGVFTAIPIGLFLALFIRVGDDFLSTFLNIFPKKIRGVRNKSTIVFLIIFLFILPIAIDGGLQFFMDYESTNIKRVITGMLAGFIGGYLIGVMLLGLKGK